MEKEHLFIVIAATFYGTITVGGQFLANLGLSLYEIAILPISVISIPMSLIVMFKREFLISRGVLRFFIVYGLIGGILHVTQFGGIVLGVPVAVVVLLLYTQPIWTTILGKILLQETITKSKSLAVVLAFIGVFVLLKPWDIESIGNLSGIFSALVAGVFLSLWVIWGRRSGINKQHYVTTTFGFTIFSTMWLWLLLPISSLFVQASWARISLNFSTYQWCYIILFGLLWGTVSHALFYSGMKRVPASTAGIILLLEPVSATVLATIIFRQAVTMNVIVGGVLILISNCVVLLKSRLEKN